MNLTNITTNGTPVDLGYNIDGKPAFMLIKSIPEIKPGDSIDLGIGAIAYSRLYKNYKANVPFNVAINANTKPLNSSRISGKITINVQNLLKAVLGLGSSALYTPPVSWSDKQNIEASITYRIGTGVVKTKTQADFDTTTDLQWEEVESGELIVDAFYIKNKVTGEYFEQIGTNINYYGGYYPTILFREKGEVEKARYSDIDGVRLYVDPETGKLNLNTRKSIILKDTIIELVYTK